MVATQLFLEAMLQERLLDVSLNRLPICKGEVRVTSEHRLIVRPVGPWIQSVETMAPTADEDQLLAPGCQGLNQFRESF